MMVPDLVEPPCTAIIVYEPRSTDQLTVAAAEALVSEQGVGALLIAMRDYKVDGDVVIRVINKIENRKSSTVRRVVAGLLDIVLPR